MKVINVASDYFMCSVGKDGDSYAVFENLYDPREMTGYQESKVKIANGFTSIEEALEWTKGKREEQEVNEIYNNTDLISPLV